MPKKTTTPSGDQLPLCPPTRAERTPLPPAPVGWKRPMWDDLRKLAEGGRFMVKLATHRGWEDAWVESMDETPSYKPRSNSHVEAVTLVVTWGSNTLELDSTLPVLIPGRELQEKMAGRRLG